MSILVAGLGISGQAVLRFLQARGEDSVLAYDTRAQLELTQLQQDFPQVRFAQGTLPTSWIAQITQLVLSPGIDPKSAWVQVLLQQGVQLQSEIALFCDALPATKQVIAITGSNGKSTVTTLVGELLKAQGYRVAVGGNLGTPALDLLMQEGDADIFVLELSSFQLEITPNLQAITATILNISPDHLDRYGDMPAYIAAKAPIYVMTRQAVVNRDDTVAMSLADGHQSVIGFSLQSPEQVGDYGMSQIDQRWYLCQRLVDGQLYAWMPVADIALLGRHNLSNCLAALALCQPWSLSPTSVYHVLSTFAGLPHRAQLIHTCAGIRWVNDSKGTNVDATVTALHSLGADSPIVLLAGGQGKGQDFLPLQVPLARYARAVITFGCDGALIAQAIGQACPVYAVENLEQAVSRAAAYAQAGDVVLLSPACASFDQFRHYAHRGEEFTRLVRAIACNG